MNLLILQVQVKQIHETSSRLKPNAFIQKKNNLRWFSFTSVSTCIFYYNQRFLLSLHKLVKKEFAISMHSWMAIASWQRWWQGHLQMNLTPSSVSIRRCSILWSQLRFVLTSANKVSNTTSPFTIYPARTANLIRIELTGGRRVMNREFEKLDRLQRMRLIRPDLTHYQFMTHGFARSKISGWRRPATAALFVSAAADDNETEAIISLATKWNITVDVVYTKLESRIHWSFRLSACFLWQLTFDGQWSCF